MNAQQTELLDKAILKVLDANRTRYGLTAVALGHLIPQFGFTGIDPEVIKDRLQYLTDKKLVEETSKLLGAANRVWRITDTGIQFIDEHP